jgi:hypothetical protein
VFRAFERLDAGETGVTIAQLEAIQIVLLEYQQADGGEFDSAAVERLCDQLTDTLAQYRAGRPADGERFLDNRRGVLPDPSPVLSEGTGLTYHLAGFYKDSTGRTTIRPTTRRKQVNFR